MTIRTLAYGGLILATTALLAACGSQQRDAAGKIVEVHGGGLEFDGRKNLERELHFELNEVTPIGNLPKV